MVWLDHHLLYLGGRQCAHNLVSQPRNASQILTNCLIYGLRLFDELLIILLNFISPSLCGPWSCRLAQHSTLLPPNLHLSISYFQFAIEVSFFEFTISSLLPIVVMFRIFSVIYGGSLRGPNFVIDEFVEVVDDGTWHVFDIYFLNFIFQTPHVLN